MPPKLTAAELRAAVDYDPNTGAFVSRVTGERLDRARSDGRYAGYRRVFLKAYTWQAARLAWLYQTGQQPRGEVDHINRDPGDNRFTNLRLSSRQQNSRNRRLSRNNTSGITGVFRGPRGKWIAQIWIKRPPLAPGRRAGTTVHLGDFATLAEAATARRAAEARIFGAFAPGA